MKTKFDTHEIAHIWANNRADYGGTKGTGSMSFNRATFYSYAAEIGKIITLKNGDKIFLLNNYSYSNTTSKHQSYLRGAIPSFNASFVVDREEILKDFKAVDLFKFYLESAAEKRAAKTKPRIRQTTIDNLESEVQYYIGEAKKVKEIFKLRNKIDDKVLARFEASKIKEEKRRRENLRLKKEADFKHQEEHVKDWRAFEGYHRSLFYVLFAKTLLRVNKDGDIETSLGVRIKNKEAKTALRFISSKRESGWRKNGEAFKIDGWDLNLVNKDGIIAGCHKLSWEEIDSAALALEKYKMNAFMKDALENTEALNDCEI